MLDIISFLAFGAFGGAVALLGLGTGQRDAALSAGLVLLSWAAGTIYTVVTGDYEGWQMSIAVCGIVMLLLLKYPPNIWRHQRPDHWRVAMAVMFGLQIVLHSAFGAANVFGFHPDFACYANSITFTGWIELLIAGGWSCGPVGHGIYRAWHRSRRVRHVAHHRDTWP